jgi:carboxyl-terminal processing protease
MRSLRLPFLSLLVLLALAPAPVRAEAVQTTEISAAGALFDEVWRTVRDNFYDRELHGLDWNAVGEHYRPQALVAAGERELADVINAMLGELNASHLGYFTPLDTAYYDLADIFSGSLRNQLRSRFSGGEVAYTGIGVFTREIDGKTFVSGVLEGLPADKAGLRVGDEILAADGAPFEPVMSFEGKAGRVVVLEIRRAADAEPQHVDVVPRRIKPNEAYLEAMRESSRIIDHAGVKIGYIHVWSYARSSYQELLARQISTGALKDADALIWDLRDGWGGASPSYLDLFNADAPVMRTTSRSGDPSVVNARWRRPAALLSNEGTRSGKEVLTYGFKKYGYGEVIGTRTAGALLAGRAFLINGGGLLLVPVADVEVDGERLEGRGVTPTIEVDREIPYAAGADPQLDRALEVLARSVGG